MLVKEHYGFRSNSSAENAAYNVINEITKAMNGRRSLGGLFCDLEKAFDCVNHKILLGKLEFYRVKGKFLDLIQFFLQQRYQKVFMNKNVAHDGSSSEWMTVTHGVPEGSILGPLLFLILVCINDLTLIAGINSKIVLFADNTSTIMTSSNQVELKALLHKTLSDINLWFKVNLLSLNINKTYLLHFRTNNNIDNALEINYMNKTVSNVPSVKFLGLLVDDTLSWDKHINQIASK
jgi:hypothetical protein